MKEHRHANRSVRTRSMRPALTVNFTHFTRTGGSPSTLAAAAPEPTAHVQICSGPQHMPDEQIGAEATANRLCPGEGASPLRELLKVVPPHANLGVKAPNLTRQSNGAAPVQRAREALESTQRLFKKSIVKEQM